MSKVLREKTGGNLPEQLSRSEKGLATPTHPGQKMSSAVDASSTVVMTVDFDDFTTSSSILEFLAKEQECEKDTESIFQEVNRLADDSDTRSVDEILREAELLMQQQTLFGRTANDDENQMPCKVKLMHKKNRLKPATPTSLDSSKIQEDDEDKMQSMLLTSEESTSKDMQNVRETEKVATSIASLTIDEYDLKETDTLEKITEGVEIIDLSEANAESESIVTKQICSQNGHASSLDTLSSTLTASEASNSSLLQNATNHLPGGVVLLQRQQQQQRRDSHCGHRSSMATPDSGTCFIPSTHSACLYSPSKASTSITAPAKKYCDKSVNSSPKHLISTLTSPVEPRLNVSREYALKLEIEQLQEKLKDTEERLQSLRIQHDSLSQLHRDLRENNIRLQEESEMLNLDVRHLNECANSLRTELQTARADRSEALKLQKTLQAEVEESRQESKRAQEQKEYDTKNIQDLQRQCREMERILIRKYPDSVSALIVASKNSGKCLNIDQENMNSRKLLEQRIAQLEADAKEQDIKAQQILANVQARFNSVQSKYETHIADLETQVLSLQEINTKLNEKIESQVRALDYLSGKKSENYYNNYTQTEPIIFDDNRHGATSVSPAKIALSSCTCSTSTQTSIAVKTTRDHSTNTIGTSNQHSTSSSTSSTANSTPNTSRPNSKQSGLRKPMAVAMGSLSTVLVSKLPVSQSDSTLSLSSHHTIGTCKEDAHLLATIRGMRVDLAIKDKAVQRLARELDECKKTIKKLQREKDVVKLDKVSNSGSNLSNILRRSSDSVHQAPASTDSQALKEAQNKVKLLEADYKNLHDKRLQDLKTLQTSHERELASCHETVRVLQQRLNERDETFGTQKRRKIPVDYYALKAKVSSLERRHTEREERLHMLVEALSKGRLNGALDELLCENHNQ